MLEVTVKPFGKRLLLGAGMGTAIAMGFTVWVSVLRLTQGTAPFDRLGTPYETTVAVYFLTLPFAGAIVGLLYPLRRHILGAMGLGFLFMFPMYVGFVMVKTPRQEWFDPFRVALTFGVSALAGSLLGYWIWWDENRKHR